MTEGRVIGSLGDLAAVPGLPSEPTLRKLIKENPDFPLLSQGKNGVSYEIDIRAAVEWLKSYEARKQAAAREQAETVKQFALELLGEDSAASHGSAGLSAQERAQLLQEELISIKVAERRGTLIRKDSVEEALGMLLVTFRERGRTFSARLAKRIDLPRDVIAAMDALMEQDQKELAARMEKIAEPTYADAATGAYTAV